MYQGCSHYNRLVVPSSDNQGLSRYNSLAEFLHVLHIPSCYLIFLHVLHIPSYSSYSVMFFIFLHILHILSCSSYSFMFFMFFIFLHVLLYSLMFFIFLHVLHIPSCSSYSFMFSYIPSCSSYSFVFFIFLHVLHIPSCSLIFLHVLLYSFMFFSVLHIPSCSLTFLHFFMFSYILSCSSYSFMFFWFFYHCVYGCMFCILLFNSVSYVFLLLYMLCSVYSVSIVPAGTARTLPKLLCCSVYCLCVNVYCTTATGCQPNCS